MAEATQQLAAEGFTGSRARLRRAANMHYQGQTFELTIPVPDGALNADAIAPMEEAFGQEHERTYGHRAGPDEPLELVNIQVVAQGIVEGERIPDRFPAHPAGEAVPPRRVYFGPDAGWLKTPVLCRTDLATAREGPCIVEEYDATCVIPPQARAVLDEYGKYRHRPRLTRRLAAPPPAPPRTPGIFRTGHGCCRRPEAHRGRCPRAHGIDSACSRTWSTTAAGSTRIPSTSPSMKSPGAMPTPPIRKGTSKSVMSKR